MPDRTFKLARPVMRGDDIRGFQQDLNFRFGAWDIGKRLEPDGDYSRSTRDAAREVCRGLGMDPDSELAHGVSPALRVRIRHPEKRTDEEVARSHSSEARQFRANLRRRFKTVVLTGVDISNNNPSVDWHAVKDAGHTFAVHKIGPYDRPFSGCELFTTRPSKASVKSTNNPAIIVLTIASACAFCAASCEESTGSCDRAPVGVCSGS